MLRTGKRSNGALGAASIFGTLATAIGLLAACTDQERGPTTPEVAGVTEAVPARAVTDRVTASDLWNQRTREVVGRRRPSSNGAARLFALVSVAQYNAVIAAENARARGKHPSKAGAAAGASAAVLAAVYPGEQSFVQARLAEDAAYFPDLPSERHADFATGVAVGQAIAATVLAYAATDGSTVPWDGTIKVGPSHWVPRSLPPQDAMWGGIRPWLMSSPDQFHPGPPPAIDTPLFETDLAEVLAISLNRTPEQEAIARYWASGYGPGGPAGFFGRVAGALAGQHNFDERRTAWVLAVMHMAVMDASVGCYEAKYAYWYLRPYEANSAITVPTGVAVPNFPSYPSAHSCLSAAAAGVLAAYFPADSRRLSAMVEEAGLSRIYAGLHFRFEITAGQQLGAAVADLAVRLAPAGHKAIALD